MRKDGTVFSFFITLFILLSAFTTLVSTDKLGIKSRLKTIKAGDKEWMANNLSVSKFANGEPIPQAKTAEEWKNAGINKQPAWCFYNNDPKNDKKYGKLYNWYAVNDSRGLAPKGWRIPTDEEWNDFPKNSVAGGLRSFDQLFSSIDTTGFWWSATAAYEGEAWCRYLIPHLYYVRRLTHSKYYGMSVRCLKDL